MRLLLMLAVAAAIGVAYLVAPSVGDVGVDDYNRSLARVVAGQVIDDEGLAIGCGKRHGRVLGCGVEDTAGSGGPASYRLTLDRSRCWTARKTQQETDGKPLLASASGCVAFRDQHPLHLFG